MRRSFVHRMTHPLAVLSAALILVIPATAQQSGEPAGRERAASELIDVLRLEEMTVASVDVMMESMIGQDPTMEQFRDVFADFMQEYFRWEDLRPHYVRLYADAFSEPELREIIAFYETPVGQKTLDVMPDLMQQGAIIGQQQIAPHLPELQRRIMERIGQGPGQ